VLELFERVGELSAAGFLATLEFLQAVEDVAPGAGGVGRIHFVGFSSQRDSGIPATGGAA